ncbi:MAG: cyclic nucleotide-binding domain-containing protein [Comamonadaceae bacterium]
MKGILGLLQQKPQPDPVEGHLDSKLFASTFMGGGESGMLVPWEARAVEVGAKRMNPDRGTRLLQPLWAKDKHMSRLDMDAVSRMEPFIDYASVAAGRDLIRQDEQGNFMVVLLTGSIAVDRVQPWGERMRLTEAVPGEMLGEMSLLDGGVRFSVCTTLTDCEIAVLSADAMDQMLSADPALTASLVTVLARKLSLRLRGVSARLSEKR